MVRFSDSNEDGKITTEETADDQNPSEVLSREFYYAFGRKQNGWEVLNLNVPADEPKNKYLYNGKEFHNDNDEGLYNYGARFYDPAIARFTTIDPLAENYTFQNPYAYAANNPIRFIDFMGKRPIDPPKYMVFLQAETRISGLITGSRAAGIYLAINNDGQIYQYGLCGTKSIGGGLVAGGSVGINAGIAFTTPNRFEGKGLNVGFVADYYFTGFSGEINGYPKDYSKIFSADYSTFYERFIENTDTGYTGEMTGVGLHYGFYLDRADTQIYASFNSFSEVIDEVTKLFTDYGIEMNEQEINDFKLKSMNLYLNQLELSNKSCSDEKEVCN